MSSSRMIALFAEPRQLPQGRYPIMLSALAHGVVIGLLSVGLISNPRIKEPSPDKRYTVRLLELHVPETLAPPTSSATVHSGPNSSEHWLPPHLGKTMPRSTPLQIAPQLPAHQILLQPDVPPNLVLPEEIPVPVALIWSQEDVASKKVMAAPPHPKTAADVHPALDRPNHEMNVADVAVTSLGTGTLPLLPSTTSPLVIRAPELPTGVPEITSTTSEQSPRGGVISLSDLRMRDGTVPLPGANQTPPAGSSSAFGRSPQEDGGTNAGTGNTPSCTHMRLPKDGKFGIVVVGSEVEQTYPEAAEVWKGRLSYTVYLHLGVAKSWILQYSTPRSAEGPGTGSVNRLEAPWPTDVIRPNLIFADINADAIIVHGLVNATGRFEGLAIVFPPQLALAKFVLDSLQQWQFRPAALNGKTTPVEVLLIIPEEWQ